MIQRGAQERPSRRRPSRMNPASAASTTASHSADHPPPYPFGTVCAFHSPPSISRLPNAPNGVSARAANAATPAGSAYTGCSRDGMSHGRLPAASRPSAVPARFMLPLRSEAGTTTSAVTVIAANPPTIAGIMTSASRAAPRQDARSGLVAACSTQGRPA